MDLKLRLETAGQAPVDLAVEIDARARVADLAAALAAQRGLRGDFHLYRPERRALLPSDQVLAEARLRQGERVALLEPGRRPPGAPPLRPAATMLVTGGPCSGLRFPLEPGQHRLGRALECELVLPDPAVSRVHLTVTVSETGDVTVADAGSSSGTSVGGVPLHAPAVVAHGTEVEIGRSLVCFGPADAGARPPADATGHVPLNRPPRLPPRPVDLAFEVPAPPSRARLIGFSISSALMPLVLGVAMYFASDRQPIALLIALLSPMMVVGTFVESWIGGQREHRRQSSRHARDVGRLDAELARAARLETERRRVASPGVALLAERAQAVDPTLWERRPDHSDFLLLRLGWGDQPSGITVELTGGERSAPQGRLAGAVTRHDTLRSVPLTVSLAEAGSLGVAAGRDHAQALARTLIAQVVTLHSPKDVSLVAAVAAQDRDRWRWLGWLPHVHPEVPAVPGRTVADTAAGARDLLDGLLALLGRRLQVAQRDAREGPAVVALLDGGAELPRAGVDRLLSQGPACGIHVVWLGLSRASLPGGCGAVVELDGSTGAPAVTLMRSGQTVRGFGADLTPPAVADELALALAPVRDIEAAARQAEIPRSVSLLELLELERQPVERMLERWQHDDGGLSARLGAGPGGVPCELSLRHDGPHGLAGGMTGAGKSELLQSMVASLAAAHSPERLTFILVDYKGGAAFKDCVDLPHTVGFVTDLDGHLVNRALTSLRAELRRREHVLREAGSKDLVELERRDPARAFPSLVIVVDEFAALATELPEFVDGMVDVAQRGRSLGIHLLLATQRPAGVINDRIRTNTTLRLSLRFSDADDSRDVIGTDDAARPGLPRGRAFARTGPGTVIEFQAAHASGTTAAAGGAAPTVVRRMDVAGEPVETGSAARATGDEEAPTDLMRVVQAAREAAARLSLAAPARPWLPTLPAVLPLDGVEEPDAWQGRRVAPYGMLDDPASQRQAAAGFDLERDGSLLVYGAGGSGKTTLLRTLAAALAGRWPPHRLHLYGLDFATRGLRPLAALPHCGDVVAADEPERALRLLGMLRRELERRKGLLAGRQAATLAEYERAGGEPLPRVAVLLDGYAGFTASFQDVDLGAPLDAFRSLVAEGRPLGMAFVITGDRAGAVPAQLAAAVGRRLVLRMANEDEYMHVGLTRSLYQGTTLVPGRGFGDDRLEVQCAIVGDDPAGTTQAAAIERLGRELRARFPRTAVPRARLLPADLPAGELPAPDRPLEAIIGLQDGDFDPARVDLDDGHVLIAGPRRSGRSTAVGACAISLARAPAAVPLFLFAPRRSSGLPRLRVWAACAIGAEACARLADRLQAAVQGEQNGLDLSRGAVVLLDDGEELLDGGAAMALESIAQQGPDRRVRLVAAVETQAAHRTFGGWLALVQRDRQAVLLDPDPSLDGALAGGVRLPARRSGLPPGRGFLVLGGEVAVVQVAQSADGSA